MKSKLGYLLRGLVHKLSTTGNTTSTSMLNLLIQHKDVEYKLDQFWERESMGVKPADEDKNTETKDFYKEYEDKSVIIYS